MKPGWMHFFPAGALAVSLALTGLTLSARAEPTPSEAGQQLVAQILAQRPAAGFTNTGVMKIHDPAHGNSSLPLTCITRVANPDWSVAYQAGDTVLTVTHVETGPTRYVLHEANGKITRLLGDQTTTPFAGSDFQVADLGLEFLHWPQQKVLKKDVHRSRGCFVLESTNPHPSAQSYTRIVSWIDEESLGIVEAEAYDANGTELKDFYPKDFKKVNGQYQVGVMVMKNEQTGSRTQLEFNLDGSSPEK